MRSFIKFLSNFSSGDDGGSLEENTGVSDPFLKAQVYSMHSKAKAIGKYPLLRE